MIESEPSRYGNEGGLPVPLSNLLRISAYYPYVPVDLQLGAEHARPAAANLPGAEVYRTSEGTDPCPYRSRLLLNGHKRDPCLAFNEMRYIIDA